VRIKWLIGGFREIDNAETPVAETKAFVWIGIVSMRVRTSMSQFAGHSLKVCLRPSSTDITSNSAHIINVKEEKVFRR
jgi:hypothetical protein